MAQEFSCNIKTYRLDNNEPTDALDKLIACSHKKGYPSDICTVSEFFDKFDIFSESFSDEDKSLFSSRVAPHIGLSFTTKLDVSGKKTGEYAIYINMTTLALTESGQIYFDLNEGLKSKGFRNSFELSVGEEDHTVELDDRDPIFFELQVENSVSEDPSKDFYTFVKELQFFSRRDEISYDGQEVCHQGQIFLENIGLLSRGMSTEDIFDVANAIAIESYQRKRVFFSINLASMSQENEIDIGRNLPNRKFLSYAEPTRMDRDLFECVKEQGILLASIPKV